MRKLLDHTINDELADYTGDSLARFLAAATNVMVETRAEAKKKSEGVTRFLETIPSWPRDAEHWRQSMKQVAHLALRLLEGEEL